MLQSKKWHGLSLLLVSVIYLFTATSLWALELEICAGGGYDDNPRLEKGSEGALFSEAEINVWWTLPLAGCSSTSITLLSFADYQLYDGLDDNWRLGGGLESSTKLSGLPYTFDFFSTATAHRNPLVDDNEFDNLSLGGRLVWFAGPRLNLEFETSLGWEDYCGTVTAGNYKKDTDHNHDDGTNNNQPGDIHSPQNTDKTEQPKHHNEGDRSDRLIAAALKTFYALNPYLDAGSELFWHHRHSSIDAERRSTYGLSVNINWHPTPTLKLVWALSGERIPYKYEYQKEERTEKIYTSEILASWRLSNWTISGAWNWSKRDSIVNEDDYRRNLWQGRLTYSY